MGGAQRDGGWRWKLAPEGQRAIGDLAWEGAALWSMGWRDLAVLRRRALIEEPWRQIGGDAEGHGGGTSVVVGAHSWSRVP